MIARAPLLVLGPLAFGLLAVAGCGPIPVDQAERQCLNRAYQAGAPHGEVALGVAGGQGGVWPTASVRLGVSSDWIARRDPSEVFDRCVYDRSGRLPTRPLAQQPGWTGR